MAVKREMELTREILMAVEAQPPVVSELHELATIPNWDPALVYGHAILLRDGGFFQKMDLLAGNPPRVYITDLSWEGHEFLSAIRSTTVWERLKRKVSEEGGAIPFAILKALAMKFAADHLGLPTP
jgi:hypothetical protein